MPLSHNLLKPLGVSTQTKKDTFSEGKKLLIILKQQQGYGLRKFLSQKELASAQLGPEKLLLCNCPVSSFLRHLPLTSVSDKNGRIIICVSRIKHVMLSLTTYSIFFSLRQMEHIFLPLKFLL